MTDKYCHSIVSFNNRTRCKILKKNGNYCNKHQKTYEILGNFNGNTDLKTNLLNLNENNYSINLIKQLNKKYIVYIIINIPEIYKNNEKLKIYLKDKPRWEIIHKMNCKFTKSKLINILDEYFTIKKRMVYYLDKEKKVKRCQAIIRGYLTRKMFGKCFLNPTLSVNSDDIDGTELWEEDEKNNKIKSKEVTLDYQRTLFSYQSNNSIYCFSLRTMRKLLNTTKKNPYTSLEFPKNVLESYRKRMDYMKENEIPIVTKEMLKYNLQYCSNDKEVNFQMKVFELFHNINLLGNYTDHEWFLNLTSDQLTDLYYYIKFNWDSYINSYEEKNKIIGINQSFMNIRQSIIDKLINQRHKRKLQNILLENIEKLINNGINDEYKRIGCGIFLTSLSRVSEEASLYIPY